MANGRGRSMIGCSRIMDGSAGVVMEDEPCRWYVVTKTSRWWRRRRCWRIARSTRPCWRRRTGRDWPARRRRCWCRGVSNNGGCWRCSLGGIRRAQKKGGFSILRLRGEGGGAVLRVQNRDQRRRRRDRAASLLRLSALCDVGDALGRVGGDEPRAPDAARSSSGGLGGNELVV